MERKRFRREPLFDLPPELVLQLYAFFHPCSQGGAAVIATLFSYDEIFDEDKCGRELYQLYYGFDGEKHEWNSGLFRDMMAFQKKWDLVNIFCFGDQLRNRNQKDLGSMVQGLVCLRAHETLRRLMICIKSERMRIGHEYLCDAFRDSCRHGMKIVPYILLKRGEKFLDGRGAKEIGFAVADSWRLDILISNKLKECQNLRSWCEWCLQQISVAWPGGDSNLVGKLVDVIQANLDAKTSFNLMSHHIKCRPVFFVLVSKGIVPAPSFVLAEGDLEMFYFLDNNLCSKGRYQHPCIILSKAKKNVACPEPTVVKDALQFKWKDEYVDETGIPISNEDARENALLDISACLACYIVVSKYNILGFTGIVKKNVSFLRRNTLRTYSRMSHVTSEMKAAWEEWLRELEQESYKDASG